MTARRRGSSPCIEFFLSLFVGVMAILGGLFIIGFLLVEPVRHPPASRAPIVTQDKGSCSPTLKPHFLPHGCTVNGQSSVERGVCSNRECTCGADSDARVCCCRSIQEEPFYNLVCPEGMSPPTSGVTNTTQCGCGACDDVPIQVHVTVANRDTEAPVPAALVLRVESPDSVSFLGLTANSGVLMFTERVGTRHLEIKVVSPGYVPYMTVPMRIQPHKRVMRVEVLLIPSMSIDVGLGGSDIVLRLGPMACLTAPADSFRTQTGERYEDMIMFDGMFVTPSDPHGLAGVPGTDFMAYNKETGEMDSMGVLFAMFPQFLSVDGEPLTSDQLVLKVSLPGDMSDSAQYSVIVYNESAHRWEKHSPLVPAPDTRGKRQTLSPIVLENENTPLVVFSAVASSNDVDCWLQGRTFDDQGAPVDGDVVSVEHVSTRNGNTQLFRFGTNTGAHSPPLVSNAVCLPVDCGIVSDGIVESREGFPSSSNRLSPEPFPEDTFEMTENAPVSFGTIFSFEQPIFATPTRSLPFYTTQQECVATGVDPVASASSYFGFREGPIDVPEQGSDSCFIKVQILDCFAENSVTITSIDPNTGLISGSSMVTVSEPPEDITEEPTMSGTMPTELVTTAASGVCDSSTATLRAACVPFVCGSNIQLLVRPSVDSPRTTLCEITSRSVLLSNPLLSNLNTNVQLIVQISPLVSADFNDPRLGLYFADGNNMMASMMAEGMCNAGTGNMATSDSIDVTTGEAATFSCF